MSPKTQVKQIKLLISEDYLESKEKAKKVK